MLTLLHLMPNPYAPHALTDYIVIVSNEDEYHTRYHQFADKVNRKLQAGYLLHGPPFAINQTLCQALEIGRAHV